MEQTPLPPLLSDEILAHLNCRCENCVRRVAKVIEADRAKTREVVQALVDDLSRAYCIDKPSLSQAKLILNIAPTKP